MSNFTTAAQLRAARYFDSLDYGLPDTARAIPQRERELLAGTDTLIAALDGGEPEQREQAALALAYVAMFMANANYGVGDGRVRADALAPNQPWSAALRERNAKITHFLELAHDAAPNHLTIAGEKSAGRRLRPLDVSRVLRPRSAGCDAELGLPLCLVPLEPHGRAVESEPRTELAIAIQSLGGEVEAAALDDAGLCQPSLHQLVAEQREEPAAKEDRPRVSVPVDAGHLA